MVGSIDGGHIKQYIVKVDYPTMEEVAGTLKLGQENMERITWLSHNTKLDTARNVLLGYAHAS